MRPALAPEPEADPGEARPPGVAPCRARCQAWPRPSPESLRISGGGGHGRSDAPVRSALRRARSVRLRGGAEARARAAGVGPRGVGRPHAARHRGAVRRRRTTSLPRCRHATPWSCRATTTCPCSHGGERIGGAYRRYARWWGDDREPVCDAGGFFVVGVDTTRPWRHRRASLSRGQIDRAALRLAGAPPDRWRIVASHHPLVARHPGDADHRPPCRRGAGALAGRRCRTAAVRPRPCARSGRGAAGLRAAQAGTAVSVRLRAEAPTAC